MRRKVTLGAAVLLVASSPVSAGGHSQRHYLAACLRSSPPACGSPRLEVDLNAGMAPQTVPRQRFAPVVVTLSGTVGSEGGGHPSALREATVAIDEGVKVDTKRLASCARRRLETLTVPEGRRACRKAIIGRGTVRIGFASSGRVLRAPLTLFNGGTSAGVTRLFIHSAAGVAGGPLVAVAQIQRRGKGLEAAWRLPRILEGDGSLLSFKLQIGRRFTRNGERHSYLSASCGQGELRAQVTQLVFRNETHAQGVPEETVLAGTLAVPCTPKR